MRSDRRSRKVRKSGKALGDFISREARDLETLSRLLNTQWATDGPNAQIGDQVAALIEATADLPYPWVSRRTGESFAALAAGQTFQYEMWEPLPQPHTPANLRQHGVVFITLRASAQQGLAAQELDRFFRNPARDRLRRCGKCASWFIDTTRNKSTRRCSRKCTIAWSNAQRTTKRKPTKRKRGSL